MIVKKKYKLQELLSVLVSRMRLFSCEKGLACLNLENNIPRPAHEIDS